MVQNRSSFTVLIKDAKIPKGEGKINGVLCFLKINGSGMEKKKDDWRLHFKEKMSQEQAHHHRKPWIRA